MGTTQTLDDVLEHYGIKGMKWGVRRTREELARARGERIKKGKSVTPTKAAKKAKRKDTQSSEDAQAARNAKKKANESGVKALSNDELQLLNQRMQLEQQYSNLRDKGSLTYRGEQAVKSTLSLGKTVNDVVAFSKTPLGSQIVNELIKKKTGK